MGNYSVDVKRIVDGYSGRKSYSKKPLADYVEIARHGIFDFDYGLNAWDNEQVDESKHKTPEEIEAYNEIIRKQLETTIINHYFNYEIAFETVGRWKQALYAKLLEIMPYYNQMFVIQSDKYMWRTFHDYEIYRDYNENRDTDGTLNNTQNRNDSETTHTIINNDNVFGNFPNASASDGYATNKTEIDEVDDITRNGTYTTLDSQVSTDDTDVTGHFEEYRIGATGKTPMNLMKEAYDINVNIYMLIVDELKDLFYFTIDFDGGYTL